MSLVAGENLVAGFAPPKGKTATLPNMVTQMLLPSSPMTITWTVTTAANATIPAGTSRHDLFVLYHANGSLFLTIVWHTTHGAEGKNTEADVAAGTWREFSPAGNGPVGSFRQKQLDPVSGNISNGRPLHYYDPNFVGTGACHATTTEELLTDAHSIGQCASWAHLFQDSLTAEGISSIVRNHRREHRSHRSDVRVGQELEHRRVHAEDEPYRVPRSSSTKRTSRPSTAADATGWDSPRKATPTRRAGTHSSSS